MYQSVQEIVDPFHFSSGLSNIQGSMTEVPEWDLRYVVAKPWILSFLVSHISFFDEFTMDGILLNCVIFSISILVIAKGAIWLVDAASRIAFKIGISELVIGLTVVAFGTSTPEVGVTVLAALRGAGDISIGNVVGSNIINFTLILGSTALFGALKSPRGVLRRDGPFLVVVTGLFVFLLMDNRLVRLEALLLLALFAGYLAFLFIKREPLDEDIETAPMKRYDPLLVVLGLAMIIGGSHFMVESAIVVARLAGISEWVIGATIVAFGTSAPEMATSLVAAIKGRHAMSLGNLFGSNIFNLLLVLGVAGSINNLTVSVAANADIWIMAIMMVIVLVFAITSKKISRREGAILTALGIGYWVFGYLR